MKKLKLHQQIISPLSMASESSDHSEKSVAGSSSTLPPSPTKSDTSINKTSSTLTASEAESDIKLKLKRRYAFCLHIFNKFMFARHTFVPLFIWYVL
ncbi:hypothetical protein NQ314_001826 [Rhamnusium bicolor]|uniref:Uncharacterized protein n=1 Tax=Rhamnusium bicolor TaxID=1586634 RepID=A0AAV8ZSF5_9CUCU|nr:hypothetical protein NQ314_001826 [Rhamnusium bicolor]